MTDAFKKLQKEWYIKLKKSGFEEIEDLKTGGLQKWHASYYMNTYPTFVFQAQREYYYLATHFLTSHSFSHEIERLIWSLHSEGMPMRKIAKEVKSKTCRVFLIIQSLRKKMLDE